MQLDTFSYAVASGWSAEPRSDLDSESTLVVVFGAPELDQVRAGTRQIGFYSYGETAPYAHGTCDLHNQTMTLTRIQESVAAA